MQTTPLSTASIADLPGPSAIATLLPDAGITHGDDAVSATQSRFPHLVELRALRDCFNAQQDAALHHLNGYENMTAVPRTNFDLIAVDYARQLGAEATRQLQRRASFLMTLPVSIDIGLEVTEIARDTTKVVPIPVRKLLTAQVAAVRDNVERTTANAVDAARSEERYCPLVLKSTEFSRFLKTQKPNLDRLIAACADGSEARRPALQAALTAFARDYLQQHRLLPSGMHPGDKLELGGIMLDHSPLSITLNDNQVSTSHLQQTLHGTVGLIIIGVDDLDGPQADPSRGTGTTRLNACGFEQLPVAQMQAGVFLQKLLVELVNLEEKVYIWKNSNKDGSAMAGPAATTSRELDYRGIALIGDSMQQGSVPDTIGGRLSQRTKTLATFDALGAVSKLYTHHHGTPLLVDPTLQAWLDSPTFYRDTTILHSPAARLQLAAIDEARRVLLATGSLGGEDNLPSAPPVPESR